MNDVYLSIHSLAKGEHKEKGSKFLAFAYPVTSETEIKNILGELKEKYWDASHHCYAYMLGAEAKIFRANDAGEPNHSAGDHILSQIRSNKITDVLVVVVRYFGGTKLGVSGLISAYKNAAHEALSHATIIEKFLTKKFEIRFNMDSMSVVMKTIKSINGEILSQRFEAEDLKNVMLVEVRASKVNLLEHNLNGLLGVDIAVFS